MASDYVPVNKNRQVQDDPINIKNNEIDYSKEIDPNQELRAEINEVEKIPLRGCFDIFMTIVSLCLYILDVSLDLNLASHLYKLYKSEEYGEKESVWWFVLTVLIVITSGVTTSTFSLKWLLEDYKNKNKKYPKLLWLGIISVHVLLIGPIYRFAYCIYYGIKAAFHKHENYRKYYSSKIIIKESELAILNTMEIFVESAPQLTLQMYILSVRKQITEEDDFIVKNFGINPITVKKMQYMVIAVGLMSLSWSLVSYQRKIRSAQRNADKLIKTSIILLLLSNIFIISPRIIALALFASFSKAFVFLFIIIHLIVMFGWFYHCPMGDDFQSRLWKCMITLVVSFANIFCIFIIHFGKKRSSFMYCIICMYIENVLLIFIWYSQLQLDVWYSVASILFILIGFWIGAAFLYIHYNFFHAKAKSFQNNFTFNFIENVTKT